MKEAAKVVGGRERMKRLYGGGWDESTEKMGDKNLDKTVFVHPDEVAGNGLHTVVNGSNVC
jgi:hypothetical protein